MSSLAASRADNFYFPPEWRPEMGGISKFQGSKGANQYQQFGIIRFELPFDGWCTKCSRHISKGTRFNAKKDKAGKYLSTQIFAFTMKCASCDNEMVIKTDPEHRTYDFSVGIRKMEQEFEADANDSIIASVSEEARAKMLSDPIFRLQHEVEDKRRAQSATERLTSLYELKNSFYKDDGGSNSALRKIHRARKTHEKGLLEEGRKLNISLPLQDPHEDDARALLLKDFSASRKRRFQVEERKKLLHIQNAPILPIRTNKNTTSRKGRDILEERSRLHAAALEKQAERRIDVRQMKLARVPGKEEGRRVVSFAADERKSLPPPPLVETMLSGYASD